MKRSSLVSVGLVVGACMALAGCASWFMSPMERILANSCEGIPQPKPGFSLLVSGIEIPYKPNSPIKIGKIDFDQADALRVSDAIFALSESRRNQCSYLAAALLGNPRPSGDKILAALDSVNSSGRQSDAVMMVLATNGADPKAAVRLAVGASEAVKGAEEKVKDVLTKPPVAEAPKPPPPGAKIGMADLSDDVVTGLNDIGNVKTKLKAVEGQIEDMKKAGPYRQFSVAGFDTGGVTLTSSMKDALSEQLSAALSAAPPALVPRVAIIGFADETGGYLANVDIGLRRAQSVAAYIERNFPKRTDIQIVSSGGVLVNVPNGRRVDLLIS